MLISSIVVGILIISTANMVSEANNRQIENSDTPYIMENIKQEAERIDVTDREERENFRRMVDSVEGFQSEATYWEEHNPPCFNVTLTGVQESHGLKCIN